MTFSRPIHRLSRLTGLLALLALLAASVAYGAATALAQDAGPNLGRNPREIAMNDEDAGKSTTRVVDEESWDERSRWVHLRWERDRDNEDVSVGPIITHNTVWVARDVEAARAIFAEQERRQFQFPESVDRHDAGLAWESKLEIGDQVSTVKGCLRERCESRGVLDLHQRVVVRKDNVVSVVYLFGRERNTTEELATLFATRVVERI